METNNQNQTQVQAQTETKTQNRRKPIIEVKNINVTYNRGKSNEVRALENVTVEILPQEYVIMFGPSGCGKSTLLYSISGLQKVTSGDVVVDDISINSLSKNQLAEFHQKKMGMIFQAFHLIDSLSVVDNVCLPQLFTGENEKKRRGQALQLLERFNIANQSQKFPSELSGGQKQRVSIARSLINNPDIIMADEPVGNLDSKSAFNVMSILKELNEKDKKTIILVTHDPSHLKYGDKIVHMKDGKIIKIEINKNKEAPSDMSPADSYIFKDGKVRDELAKAGLIKQEIIPPDLRFLMKAFKNLSPDQLGVLLVPFKAQQLFSHIFFSVTDDQIELAKKSLQDFIYEKIDGQELIKALDDSVERGGAGWDRRNVEKFVAGVFRVMDLAQRIDFANISRSAQVLSEYLTRQFELELTDQTKKQMLGVIADRLSNKIGTDEVKKILDMPENKGGLGLNRRMAVKIASELEIIILLRYSE